MPRRNELKDFGSEFEQLVLRVDKAFLAGADEVPIGFTDHKVAYTLRFRVYDYFKALQKSGARPDLTVMVTNWSMRIAGTTLVFYRRGEDQAAAALRGALGLEKGFADGPSSHGVLESVTPLTEHLAHLASIRAARGNKP